MIETMSKYSEKDIENALHALASTQMNLTRAALSFGITKTTLSRRLANNNQGFHGSGSTTKLSRQTEELIVHMLQAFSDWGYGLTNGNVRTIVEDYLRRTQQLNLFKNGKPGKDWLAGLKRFKSGVLYL
jgi:hypothetical protein